MKQSLTLITLFFFIFLINCTAQDFFTFQYEGDQLSMEEYMAIKKTPGISVVTYKNWEPDTTMTWGYRDRENKLSVNDSTIFQAGSLTISVTHYALLRLSEQGKIDLDQAANDYLTSWKIPEKSFTTNHPVTVRELILQKRGFNHGSKPKGYTPDQEIPTLLETLNGSAPSQEIAVKLKKDKNKSGNSCWSNPIILQQLLEDVLQKDFASIIQELVFDPLDMKNSYIAAALDQSQIENAAVGYDKQGDRIKGDRWIYPELGAAGLWTTPSDYAKFTLHLIKASKGIDNQLISQKMAQQAIYPESSFRSHSLLYNQYNDTYYGGASMGFRTQMKSRIEDGWLMVIFMNSHENWPFMNDVVFKVEPFLIARQKATQSK